MTFLLVSIQIQLSSQCLELLDMITAEKYSTNLVAANRSVSYIHYLCSNHDGGYIFYEKSSGATSQQLVKEHKLNQEKWLQ